MNVLKRFPPIYYILIARQKERRAALHNRVMQEYKTQLKCFHTSKSTKLRSFIMGRERCAGETCKSSQVISYTTYQHNFLELLFVDRSVWKYASMDSTITSIQQPFISFENELTAPDMSVLAFHHQFSVSHRLFAVSQSFKCSAHICIYIFSPKLMPEMFKLNFKFKSLQNWTCTEMNLDEWKIIYHLFILMLPL